MSSVEAAQFEALPEQFQLFMSDEVCQEPQEAFH